MIPTFIAYYTGFHRSLWKGQARDTGYMLVEDCGLWIVDCGWQMGWACRCGDQLNAESNLPSRSTFVRWSFSERMPKPSLMLEPRFYFCFPVNQRGDNDHFFKEQLLRKEDCTEKDALAILE